MKKKKKWRKSKMLKSNDNLIERPTAVVYFSPKAMAKMLLLISDTATEIGWHGYTRRLEKGKYIVDDITLFPQKVSAANVHVDNEEYMNWMMDKLIHQEELGTIRFHGHSHVNMGVTASGVDLELQNDTLDTLPEDGYYIFLIINKSLDCNFRIKDNIDEIEYKSPDIRIELEDKSLVELANDYEKMIKKEYTYTQYYNQTPSTKSYNKFDTKTSYYGKNVDKDIPFLDTEKEKNEKTQIKEVVANV